MTSDLPLTDPRHPFHAVHMAMALDEARAAAAEDEVPIGAVIVSMKDGVLGAELGYVSTKAPRDQVFRRELEAELQRLRGFLSANA